MNIKHSNGGFTLVEFVVTIAIASMITLAATSMLLLGLRIHHKSNATAGQLNTVSMLYSVMDTIASEKTTTCNTVSDASDPTIIQTWEVKTGSTIINYENGSDTISLNGTPFISNVTSSNANLDTNGLLTIFMKTEQTNEYTFSIYCRKGVGATGP